MELLGALVLLVGLVVLLFALLAPLETLRWWAGWTRERAPDAPLADHPTASPSASLYVVYLSGVAAIDPGQMHEKESSFLDLVATRIAPAVLIRDVFPYSVTNNPLTGERPLAWLWQRVNQVAELAEATGLSMSDVLRQSIRREHAERFGEQPTTKKKPKK